MVSDHPANFDDDKHCSSGDIKVLADHVISEDRVIKESCDILGRSLSWQVSMLSSLVAKGVVVVEI